jgi:predicted molibdopterin-dependent oxidoreductase YjgC
VQEHGITAELLGKLETLIVSDIFTERDGEVRALRFAGLRAREKRGSFTNREAGCSVSCRRFNARRRARRMGLFTRPVYNVTGRSGFQTIEGLFNEMAKDVPAYQRPDLGGSGDPS